MENFKEISIKAILSGYQNGKFTPHDIIATCVNAFKAYEPTTHAWECFDEQKLPQQLLKTVRSDVQSYRKLEGIPIGIKDIFNTEDFPTQMGSPLWSGFTPGNDARLVGNLKLEGAVIAGKTVTAEFAVHALGKTLNPHGADRSPGTSSSGSAAAVSTGMVPAALGSQTAGSIIRPASYCGVYAMKPSYGLLPRTGILKTTDTLDTMGFFTHFAEDLSIMLDVLSVKGRNYPFTKSLHRSEDNTNSKIRLGVVESNNYVANAPYAIDSLQQWVSNITQDSKIEINSFVLPNSASEVHDWHRIIYHRSLAYYFAKEFQGKHLISDEMNECIEDGLMISKSQYESGIRFQSQFASEINKVFDRYDGVVCLSTYGEAVKRNEKEIRDLCLLWTLSYTPTINIPAFKSPNGLPLGLQLVGKRYNDHNLLGILNYFLEKNYVTNKSNSISSKHEIHQEKAVC